jgi:hypothetical protein
VEATCFSETLVDFQRTAQRCNPEVRSRRNDRFVIANPTYMSAVLIYIHAEENLSLSIREIHIFWVRAVMASLNPAHILTPYFYDIN